MSRTRLASAAGISVSYLNQLEQGVAINPSQDVVDRIADVLQIGPVERQHLHDLCAMRRPGDTPAEPQGDLAITPVMREAVDSLHPHLCGYVDDLWNILYCNAEYARIYRHIQKVGNVLIWFFTVPDSKSIMVEWEREAQLTVAWFRALMVRRSEGPRFDDLLQELGRSEDFTRMWLSQKIEMGRHSPYMRVRDLDNGREIRLLAEVHPSPNPTQPVQMYLGIRTGPAS